MLSHCTHLLFSWWELHYTNINPGVKGLIFIYITVFPIFQKRPNIVQMESNSFSRTLPKTFNSNMYAVFENQLQNIY